MIDTVSILKKNLVLSILKNCNCVFTLQTYPSDVKIPNFLKYNALAVLEIGMNIQIKNLRIDDDGVFGTLSFGGNPHDCFVPWVAIVNIRAKDASLFDDIDLSKKRSVPQKQPTNTKNLQKFKNTKANSKTPIKRQIPDYIRVIK